MTMAGPVLCPAPHREDAPKRAADGLILCLWHRDRLERHLAELPALHQACEATLLGRGGTNGAGPVSGSQEPSWAVSDAPSHARQAIAVELHTWTRIVLDEGPWTVPPADTLTSLAAWLVARVDWCCARPWADEMARTIADTHREAWAAAYPNPARRIDLGPCVEAGCEGRLVAYVRPADSLLPATVDCDVDPEHTWPADQWQQLGRRAGIHMRPDRAVALARHLVGH